MRRQRDAALQGFIARVQSNQFVIYITVMDDQTDQIRKPRADAVRNRERVLEAAKIVFNAGGPEASLEAVAKRAGVGIGTLYRHFPTREAESWRWLPCHSVGSC